MLGIALVEGKCGLNVSVWAVNMLRFRGVRRDCQRFEVDASR